MDKNIELKSKEEFLQWLKTASSIEIQKFFIEWILKRKEEKRLVFALTQVELRSLGMPGINYLNKLFGSYYEFCKSVQLINKYENFSGWSEVLKLDKRRKIYIDSREKNLLEFSNVSSEVTALKYGDYAFSDDRWTGKVVVERKSMTDFVGTLSKGFIRFEKELQRAKQDGAYLIILIEENLSNALDFRNKCPYLHRNIVVPPSYIFHRVRELIQQYDNIQFLFINSHDDASDMVERLFSYGKDIKKYDLQLLRDIKII